MACHHCASFTCRVISVRRLNGLVNLAYGQNDVVHIVIREVGVHDHATGSPQNIDCPRGHGRMATVVNPSLLHVYFERCVVCNGIWFDAGEFADYSKAQVIALFSG